MAWADEGPFIVCDQIAKNVRDVFVCSRTPYSPPPPPGMQKG